MFPNMNVPPLAILLLSRFLSDSSFIEITLLSRIVNQYTQNGYLQSSSVIFITY